MEIEQMMARLRAEIRTNQANTEDNQAKEDASLREMRAQMLAEMETNQEKMMTKLDAHYERDDGQNEHPAGENEGLSKKTTAMEKIEPVSEHEGVPNEEAAVETFEALKKRLGDRNIALGCRGKPKKRTQGNGGSRMKLVAALRGRKGKCRQGQGQDNVARRALKGRTFWKRPKCNNGILGPKPERTAAPRKQEGVQQDGQADFRTGVREASSRDFHRVTGSE
jgi:hypothetical protein